jgi:asparagine synthase (glutamine-hydrolysing)
VLKIDSVETRITNQYLWEINKNNKGHTCYSVGGSINLDFIIDTNEIVVKNLISELLDKKVGFCGICETPKYTIAYVDRVRSYPLFYSIVNNELYISNRVEELEIFDYKYDDNSVTELQMSNFVSGKNTIFKNVFQIKPGEVLIYNKNNNVFEINKYYSYYSESNFSQNRCELIKQHSNIVNSIFNRLIEKIIGKDVLIPLSGGMDSRLILCKLKSLGCKNIKTFSYGPVGNHDAKWAKRIAKQLDVPWIFVPYNKNNVFNFFWSDNRKEYWKFAFNGVSIPFMVDEIAIDNLISNGYISDVENTVVINGQSGDFISGGHVTGYHLKEIDPEKNYNVDIILNAIIGKHYSLNAVLLEKYRKMILDRIIQELGVSKNHSYKGEHLIKLYERWECEERQSKCVINGQRSYDYHNIDWDLPLWDIEMMNFWSKIPYKYKINQNLYKEYLNQENLYGIFKDFNPSIWNWQRGGMMIFPIAKIVGLLFGHNAKVKFYNIFKYFGRYQNHYIPFGFREHLKNINEYNSPLGRYSKQLLTELRIIK